jgi:hypothetical protein
MAIEIKQLLIKSNVVDDAEDDSAEAQDAIAANIKQDVINECRRLVLEMLSDKGLR